MSQYGEVLESIILIDNNTQTSRGFGFVTFASNDVAEMLIDKQVTYINGRKADIKPAEPKQGLQEKKNGNKGRRNRDVSSERALPTYGVSPSKPQAD